MGEIAHADLGRVRRLADRLSIAGSEVADMHVPELAAEALRGSAASAAVATLPVVDQFRGIASSLWDWATAARASADAFERADSAGGDRFVPP